MSDAWRPLPLDTLETWLRGADIAARLASGVALHPAPETLESRLEWLLKP
jgi:hypothetical protein